jgi:hypothetical protein
MIFADLIAKWRQLDAESERVNAFPDLSVEVKDAVEGLAFEAFTEIRDTPATNMDELGTGRVLLRNTGGCKAADEGLNHRRGWQRPQD